MPSLHGLPEAIKVNADQCAYGLTTEVEGEERLAKKPLGFSTKSWCVARELDRKCDNYHAHFSLMESRSSQAAAYPPGLYQAVC